MKRPAYLISIVFDPVLLIPLVFLLIIQSSKTESVGLWQLSVLMFFYLILPFLAFLLLLKTGRIKDWWMSRREDRYLIYFLVLIFHAGAVLVSWFWFDYVELAGVLGAFWLLLLSLTIANIYTKVSIHVAVSSAFAWWLTFNNGWEQWWWTWLVIPVVAWSRYRLKKHTVVQSLLAFVLTIIILQLTGVF